VSPAATVQVVEYAQEHARLHALRGEVFIHEQGVPAQLERDALDPLSIHVVACAADGRWLGAARLTPDHRIGRMAVLASERGRGVGAALLQALVDQARQRGWPRLALNAQVQAQAFYARAGFVPHGPRVEEAGILHRAMQRALPGPSPVEDVEAAAAVVLALAGHARRRLSIYSRSLDPGLFDRSEVLDALRRFAVRGGQREVRIVLQDAAWPQRNAAPLLPLAQRLPSVFAFRQAEEPLDLAYPSAYVFNDTGGALFRPLGNRFDGEGGIEHPVQAQRLQREFERVWERSRPLVEYRALG
jgi:predicted GNAT family N-acyltransferase